MLKIGRISVLNEIVPMRACLFDAFEGLSMDVVKSEILHMPCDSTHIVTAAQSGSAVPLFF